MATGNREISSNFKLWCLAIVAKDKAINSYEIEFFPKELITNNTMNLNKTDNSTITNNNRANGVEQVIGNKTNTVTASWLSLDSSNRLTPPDVVAGEHVLIYKYSESDKYFWVPIYNELDIRKHEKVIYAFSNKSKKTNINESIKKSYTLEINTLDKIIALNTKQNDGEATVYNIVINTKNGMLYISDGNKNSIILDSTINTISINSKGNINLDASNSINIKSKDINILADNIITSTGNSINTSAESSVNLKANSSVNIDGSSGTNINSPNINLNGFVKA